MGRSAGSMPDYSVLWLEIATEQYRSLPIEARQQIEARVAGLLAEPLGRPEAHDATTDQWVTDYGSGVGLILYAVVPDHQRVIILRLISLS